MASNEMPGWLETIMNINPGLAERAKRDVDEMKSRIDDLEQWKKEQIETVEPLLKKMRERPGLKVGDSCHSEALKLIEQRDDALKMLADLRQQLMDYGTPWIVGIGTKDIKQFIDNNS